ncbi:hypothetical protein Lal_00021955 [Lupinus albus]|nr:hypothetical protein Lal_00021955 [Lupinus albus]
MSTSRSFDMIMDLNDSKYMWKIAVRITEIWYVQLIASMFTSWMEANEKYVEGRTLSYAQYFPNLFMSKGIDVGNQENLVLPCTGELYYLRMMLTVVKGPRSYEDIRTISEIQYPTFRDACFAMALLKVDRNIFML